MTFIMLFIQHNVMELSLQVTTHNHFMEPGLVFLWEPASVKLKKRGFTKNYK